MTVAIDASASAATASGGAASITYSHTCTGTQLLLVVMVALRQPGGETVTGVTYNGVALTSAGNATNAGSSRVECWILANPATGANNIVVTFSASVDGAAGSTSFTGAATTVSGVTTGTGSASLTPSIAVPSAASSIVLDGVAGSEGSATTTTAGAGQTKQSEVSSGAGPGNAHVWTSTEAGAASVTMDWTLNRNNSWSQIGVSVDIATSGVTHGLASLGAGR